MLLTGLEEGGEVWSLPGDARLANNNFGAGNCTEDRMRLDLAEVLASCQHRLVPPDPAQGAVLQVARP